jgi:hypothetical protein
MTGDRMPGLVPMTKSLRSGFESVQEYVMLLGVPLERLREGQDLEAVALA